MRGKRIDLSSLVWSALVAIAYVGAAEVGFSLAFATAQVTAVWPPTGIAIAALLLRGASVCPGIFLGAFVSNALSNEPLFTAALIAVGNTGGPLFGVWLVRRLGDFDIRLQHLRDVMCLCLGVAAAMMVTASNGVVNLAIAGIIPWPAIPSVWWVWWIGDAMGALLVAPVILTIFAGGATPPKRASEFLALVTLLVAIAAIAFSSNLPLAYPVFPIVIWIALRFGQREGAVSVLLVCAIAVWQTIHDRGPFVVGSLDQRMIMLVTFMAVLALTALVLGALSSERTMAEAALRAEDRLRESEEQFRSSFETAAHGMALVSLDGHWIKINAALCEITGYSEPELLALDFQKITHPDDLAADLASVRNLLDGNIDSYQMEKRYIHKHGHIVWGLLSASLVRNREGSPRHFVAQVINISRRKAAEHALIEASSAADSANRAKDRFLAVMSHELRTPMTGILGMADLLYTTDLTAEQAKFTDTLARSGRTLLNLLNDILDYSKIEAGQMQIERAPFLLSDLLRDTQQLFSGPAAEKGLSLQVGIPSQFQGALVGDATRIRQVLSNLISNAIKFTSTGGVTVTVEQSPVSDGGVLMRMSVADSGVGISQEALKRLFQPFAQADASITRKFGGTGLGLAISRNLARAMGGEIEISSHEGKGSVFTFSACLEADRSGLAASRAASAARADQDLAARATENKTRPLKVLLAEDTAPTRMLVTTVLTKMGLSVTAVADGAAAVAAVKADRYDIVLMDMQMPIMDGPDAIAAIRHMEKLGGGKSHIPIIALTADVRLEGQETYLRAGADAFIGKPIDWKALSKEMDRLASPHAADPVGSS